MHTQKHSQKAGPFSVARLKMDLPFHNRLAGGVPALLHPSPPPAIAIMAIAMMTIAELLKRCHLFAALKR